MIGNIFKGYTQVLQESALALVPLLVIFFIYQLISRRLKRRNFVRILKGVLISYVGLTLFLQGVNIGYLRAGEALGANLAALPTHNWLLIPVGFILGFTVTMAEPSVYVLVQEIERVTGGSLPRRVMLMTLCIGVAAAIALSMLKTLLHISLWAFIVPGYILALILAYIVPPAFTSIAFDSGGVATGTMTATFLLSLSIGAANQMEHADPLLDGFGIIALVALVPTLTVLLLGLLYKQRENKIKRMQQKSQPPQEKDYLSSDNTATMVAPAETIAIASKEEGEQ